MCEPQHGPHSIRYELCTSGLPRLVAEVAERGEVRDEEVPPRGPQERRHDRGDDDGLQHEEEREPDQRRREVLHLRAFRGSITAEEYSAGRS